MSTFDTPMDWFETEWDDPWHPVAKPRVESDRVPVGPVRAHIARLRHEGWTRRAIAAAAGVTPHGIQSLELVTVAPERRTAEKVLAVSGPPPKVGPGGHPTTRSQADLFEQEQAAVSWVERAACRGMDPNLFFPKQGDSVKEIRAICARCPVRVECGEKALANNERHGVWGGKTERERVELRRARRGAA